MDTLTATASKKIAVSSFTPSDTYTGKFLSYDEIIDVYERGCNDGFSNYIKNMKTELEKNIGSAQATAEAFLNILNSKKEICNRIFLRVNDLNNFDFLYAIDEKVFFNTQKSKKYYNDLLNFEDSNPNVSISFLPASENLNTNMLIADKYLFFYVPDNIN